VPGGWSWDDDDDPRARRAGQNARRQAKRLREHIAAALAADPSRFTLTPALLCELDEIAIDGLIDNPGQIRTRDLIIAGSRHEPPPWQEVPALVDEMCSYVNEGGRDAVELAAFTLWRLCWIHPFEDGNGRTARAVAYLVLCVSLGADLPGEVTIPERIVWYKGKYHSALEAADRACKAGRIDVSEMTALLRNLLEAQLLNES
jgi:Fic family protein